MRIRTDDDGQVIDADRRTARVGATWVRWTAAMKRDFLDHLSGTCDVRASAAAIGVDPASVYRLRRRDAAFSADWEVALRLGYQMLETQLVGHALDWDGSNALTGGVTGRAVDVQTALRLLTVHREAMLKGAGAPRGGVPQRRHTLEEIDAALLKAIAGRTRRDIADAGVPALPAPVAVKA